MGERGGGGGLEAIEKTVKDALGIQGCIRREGTGAAVGGGCQSGWGRLLSNANAIEGGTCRQGDSGWA